MLAENWKSTLRYWLSKITYMFLDGYREGLNKLWGVAPKYSGQKQRKSGRFSLPLTMQVCSRVYVETVDINCICNWAHLHSLAVHTISITWSLTPDQLFPILCRAIGRNLKSKLQSSLSVCKVHSIKEVLSFFLALASQPQSILITDDIVYNSNRSLFVCTGLFFLSGC